MVNPIYRAIQNAISPVRRKMRRMVSRAIIKIVDDSFKAQSLQVTLFSDEVRDDVERFQEYGFTSVPVEGCEALFLAVNGDRDHGVVVATADREFRPKDLSPGDVALYDKDNGIRVYCEASSGVVHIGGGTNAAEFVALSQKVDTEFSRIWDMLDAWVTVPNDGGAVLKALAVTAGPLVQSVAASKAKAT